MTSEGGGACIQRGRGHVLLINCIIFFLFLIAVGTHSYIGTRAMKYVGEPTMWLNLTSSDDNWREYVVMHEFGLVLGLGHQNQRKHLAEALDKEAVISWMINKCNMDKRSATARFKADYAPYPDDEAPEEGSKFDPWSVMSYP